MTRILGLDPAGSFGWTLLDDDRYLDGGVTKFKFPTKVQQEKKGIPRGKKWMDALEWIETIPEHKPDFIIMEDVRRHVSTLAGHSYGFFRYAVEAICAKNDIPFYPIIVTQWKLTSIGYGGSDKDRIAAALQEKYPDVEFLTNDHSDACGIALAGHILNQENKLKSLYESVGGKRKK
jgi:Holliday junction resolvasome RuvABC endonuclease subunit